MKVVIAVSSKHGGTRGIADAIGDELRKQGYTVTVADVATDPPVAEFDAVILGSAVYMGRWMADARRYLQRHLLLLETVPVWLFSSGPLGDHPDATDPKDLDKMMELTQARGHRMFVGKLDLTELGVGERLVARTVKAPVGDFRDRNTIREWAREIGVELESLVVPA